LRRALNRSRSQEIVEFPRITVDQRQTGGVPRIRGLRIPVATVVGMVAHGMRTDEILAASPDLERAAVRMSRPRLQVAKRPVCRSFGAGCLGMVCSSAPPG
jgi:uncharacterized protein (DUF433 family)